MPDSNAFGEAFEGRHVFLTGATGMLGTSLLVKMTKDTTVSKFHVLVRGGEGRVALPRERSHTDCAKFDSGTACMSYCLQQWSTTFGSATKFRY
jgi:hypothetical protein